MERPYSVASLAERWGRKIQPGTFATNSEDFGMIIISNPVSNSVAVPTIELRLAALERRIQALEEAVLGGTACQSAEHAVPETTTNDAQRG